MAGPAGGVIVEGQGSVSTPNAGTTVIDQSSHRLLLNWNSFNVGASESVQFNQPSSKAVAFNRILDQNPSQIFGRIDANGQVVLVNPNGLLIGRTAQLNVNSLVASSLDAIDFDAQSGRYRFSTTRADVGAVINEGAITAGRGGSVTLLGGRVSNTGSILADYGTVNLAAGSAATIDLAGDGLLRLEVGSQLLANSSGAASAVENSGAIQANGGRVLLTASAMSGVFANLVNNTGVVRANRIENTGGVISLVGAEGMVLSSGTLDASAGDSVSSGGSVSLLGDRVGLLGNAVVDVSGATGGGTALIGGDYQGSNPNVLNASRTYVSAGATLNADAGALGDGGRIIVWANDGTRYDGSLTARGGSLWGNGGFAEVSGKGSLSFNGMASLSAPHGTWGTLLLDPTDITIAQGDGTGTTAGAGLNDGDYLVSDDAGIPVTIDNATIVNLLKNTGNVTLRASNTITQQAGADIDVQADAGAFGRSLTLQTNPGASADITLNAAIRTNNGAVTLDSGHAIVMGTGSSIDAGASTVTLTAANNITLTSIATGGAVNITSTNGALLNDADTSTRVAADTLHLTVNGASAIGASGAGNAIDIDVSHLYATQASGSMFIRELNGLTLENLASGGSIDVASAGGSITARTVQGDSGVLLSAPAGSIVDDGVGTGISSSTGTVSLAANSTIGTVSNFALRQGNPIRIATAAKVAAAVASSAGQINLNVPSGVTVDAGAIRLGSGIGRTGQVLVQSTGALDASQFATGAIDIGGSNNASVALGTNGLLRLSSAGSVTNAPAGTLLLHGGDVVDNDGTPNQLSVNAGNLILEATAPTANKTLVTTVNKLDASFGTNRNLTVTQTGNLILGDIDAGGGDVTITATGASISDDNNASTAVAGNAVTLTAAQLGNVGNELDTKATSLVLTSTAGAMFVREANAVAVTATATGGPVDVRTLDGAMTVSSASGSGVTLETAGTAGRDLTLSGAVNGNGGNVTLTAGGGSSGGNIVVNGTPLVSANLLTLTGATVGVLGGARLQTSATSIDSTSTAGSTFITEADDLSSLTASATGGVVDVQTTNGAMTVSSITGSGVTLATGGASKNLTVNGAIDGGGGAVALTAGGAGGAIVVSSTVNTTNNITLTAGTIGNRGAIVTGAGNQLSGAIVTAKGLSVGALGARLNTSAATLDATSSAGGVYVQQSGGLALTASATGGDVNVATTNGALSVSSATGANVALSAGGVNRSLNVNGAIDAGSSGNVVLTATGAIVAGGGNQVTAGSLTATGSSIGAGGARLATTVASLDTTSTSGGTFVTESDGVALTASATGGAVDVRTTNGALAVASASGAGGMTLTAGGAGNALTLNGAVNGGTGPVALAASGDGAGINLNSTISTSGNVSLVAGSTTTRGAIALGASHGITAAGLNIIGTSIGTSGTRLQTTATSLDATSTNGDIYVQESNGLALTVSATGGTVNVATTNGALAVTSASGNGLTLAAGGANDLTVNGLVNGGPGGVVALTAGGAIVAGGGNRVSADTLIATGTAIGTAGSRLATTVASLVTHSTNGGTFITEDDAVSLTANVTNGALDVETTNGALTVPVANRSGTGGGVRLVSGGAGNALTVSGAIDGGNGPVVLAATGANGGINLGGGVSTTGDVTIAAGSAASRGAIAVSGGSGVAGNAVSIVGTSIGTAGGPLLTTATSLNATSTNGGIFVREADGLALTASATGGAVSVATLNGALDVAAASGAGVTLTSGGAGNGITVSGPVNAGASDVALVAQGDGAGIALNGTVTTSGGIQLSAGSVASRGAITAGAGNQLNAGTLGAVGSSIGAAGGRLNTSVATLNTSSTHGGTFVNEADALTLAASASGGAVDVQTANGTLSVTSVTGSGATLVAGGVGQSLDVNGAVDGGAGDIMLGASGVGGTINLNAPVTTTGNATLSAGSAVNRGAIIAGAGGHIAANALTATAASIGAINARLATTVTSLNATGTNGGIYVTEADGLSLSASATGGSLDVQTTNGALSVASASATGVTLTTNGDGNDLNVNGPVSGGAGDVSLLTLGAASNIKLAGVVSTAGNASLSAGSPAARGAIVADAGNEVVANFLVAIGRSIGSAGSALNTDVVSIDATSSNGSIRVAEANGLNLSANASGGSLDVTTANGPLTVLNAHGDGGVSLATGGSNDLILDGAVSAATFGVSLTSSGRITLGVGNQVAANSLTLSAAAVGTSSSRLNTTIDSLDATTSGGGIYVSESGALSLRAFATGGEVDVRTTNGALDVTRAVGDGVTLKAAGDGNSITVTGLVSSTAGVTVAAGSVNKGGAVLSGVNGLISAATSVDLSGSAIGAGDARVNTTAGSVTANSSNGGIFLNHNGTLDLTANAIGGALDVQAGGPISVTAATGNGVKLSATLAGNSISVNGKVNGGAGDVVLTAGTSANRGAIVAAAGNEIAGISLVATGSAIGSAANPLNTRVATLSATSTNGGTYVHEADGLALTANANGGAVDVQTANGSLVANAVTGSGVALRAGGTGSSLTLNGNVDAGTGDVVLAANGAIVAGAGSRVTAHALDVSGSAIGSSTAQLNTSIDALKAVATNGDIYISEQNGLSLVDVHAVGNVAVAAASGDIAVSTVSAGNDASLTASAGAITDDGDDTTRLTARAVTLLARSIGAPSTVVGTTINSKPRLDTDATTIDATATSGGIFIDELNGLASASVQANGGSAGDIELLTATGDLNLQKVSASDTLLLSAGHNIFALPGLGTIGARAAELRAGGADSSAGHIGTLADPLSLQLSAGNTLRMFVPQTVNPQDAARAPATLPSAGVLSTLSLFNAPSAASVQAGFGQFLGVSDSQFTSPAEALVRAIQNQTSTVQTVLGLDWASFDPNVSLFGTLDPAVCLPGDQRDEEKGASGC